MNYSVTFFLPNRDAADPESGSSGGLGSLSVNVFSVANFYDVNQQLLIVDGVQDTIVTLSYPIPVEVTC
jgi:hypothetical protein